MLEGLKQFYADTTTEFKKISWPARDEVQESTVIVCVTILFVMVLLASYDGVILFVTNFASKLFGK